MSSSARVATSSPRMRQPYSPRHPSPLGFPPTGFPPLAPHMAFQNPAPYPATPSRPVQPKGPTESRVAFPPDARRPLAGAQRPRSQPMKDPPPALVLSGPYHPPTQLNYPAQSQPGARRDMSVDPGPPSPTNSSTSSLSLYSAESLSKNFPVEVVGNQGQRELEQEKKAPGIFCGCISFKALFGFQSIKQKILDPPAAPPAPGPQMVQFPRRRPTPLNL
ncbi:hypothetical protein D9619_007214 [Psilocybe cf. subviscida]|uniref:Uncharacterized protein n=1 Tax=Psilocybe cf. subviscida TaxID=2480587 RepID=A0A8H5EWS4_9AGAR|nr:hypothetical protein D9619_007214 [Psilocybe cf. subviscida]